MYATWIREELLASGRLVDPTAAAQRGGGCGVSIVLFFMVLGRRGATVNRRGPRLVGRPSHGLKNSIALVALSNRTFPRPGKEQHRFFFFFFFFFFLFRLS